MTTLQRTNWENLTKSHGTGSFTRVEAKKILPEEELNRLIELGLILEIGSYLEMRDGDKIAS